MLRELFYDISDSKTEAYAQYGERNISFFAREVVTAQEVATFRALASNQESAIVCMGAARVAVSHASVLGLKFCRRRLISHQLRSVGSCYLLPS